MDPELLELLNRLQGNGEPLTDDELVSLRASIHAIRADIDTSNPTPEDIATLTEVRDNLLAIKAVEDARTAERETRAAEAAAIVADIPELPEPVAEVEPEPEVTDDVVAEAEAVVEGAPEPVAAAATPPVLKPPSISHLAQRRPQRNAPVARPEINEETGTAYGSVLTAAANLQGIPTGAEIDGKSLTLRRWAESAGRTIGNVLKSSANNPDRDGEQIYLASKRTQFPPERYLSDQDSYEQVTAKIDAVTSPAALSAAGGICGPVAVDYSVQNISVADRPVTQAMAQFGASRGGLRFILPHTLASVTADGPVGVWTNTNDSNPVNPTQKVSATYHCQPVQEVYVDAITSSVQFSNFQTMFFPEQVTQYMQTLDAAHARLAEATMLQEMISGASWIANEQFTTLGTTRDILAAIDRSAAAIRYRNRMANDAPLRVLYPEWLEDNIRTDLARQLPGDSGAGAERLATTDAEIDGFFRNRALNNSSYLDSPTGEPTFQGWVVQGNGALLPWPNSATILIYPEGSFTWLNGGELNLGMIRSATLALQNQVLFFTETFERAVFRGVEAGVVRCSICPSGATSGTVDIHGTICSAGS